jgi:hypothetical protein
MQGPGYGQQTCDSKIVFHPLCFILLGLRCVSVFPLPVRSGKVLPNFREWAETVIGLNIDDVSPAQEKMKVPAIVNKYTLFFLSRPSFVFRFDFMWVSLIWVG